MLHEATARSVDDELCFADAQRLVEMLRERTVSAVELLRAFLAQIEQLNPLVNAIPTLLPERQLLQAARAADREIERDAALGALHGLPLAIKDVTKTRGIRTTFGSRIYADFCPTSDELYVERCRQARRAHHRQDQHAGVRRRLADLQRGVRRDAQSIRSREGPAAAAAAVPPQRSPAEWFRSPTARTWAARCATPRVSATWSAFVLRRAACRDWKRALATLWECTVRWRAPCATSRVSSP